MEHSQRFGWRTGSDRVDHPTVAALPPFLRVLLVTDGTVTRALEAYFWERIQVDVLGHAIVPSEQEYPHIGVSPGESIVRRSVILRGQESRLPYAFATSVISTRRLSLPICQELVEQQKGIGEFLLSGKVRTYREILDVRRMLAGNCAPHLEIDRESCVVARSYTISHTQHASIQIEECFPECRYIC